MQARCWPSLDIRYGKNTLLSLLLRFNTVQQGQIRLDDTDIS